MANIIRKKLPVLYGLSSSGKIKTIEYSIEELPDGTCEVVNQHGYIDGKKQVDKLHIKLGKNIGRSNETTILEQAVSEATSKWKAKLDKNYTKNRNGKPSLDEVSLLPMLAQTFDKIDKHGKQIGRKKYIKYPCLTQAKLNGLRCMTRIVNNTVKFTSRKYKPYNTVLHLKDEVEQLLKFLGYDKTSVPIDGELYTHGFSLQLINRLVKKYRPGETEKMKYYIYDTGNIQKTNIERYKELKNAFDTLKFKYLELTPTKTANSEQEVKQHHNEWVRLGYEGVIIRNKDGKYIYGHRSNDLQKYKEFIDDEFKVVGFKTGTGRETGAIVFICATKNPTVGGPETFEVRPRGSIEQRKEWTDEFTTLKGRDLTVRFQEYSEDNIPIFPVGISIRLDEDNPNG